MYVLKAKYHNEDIYYMNIIMFTSQEECAETYNSIEEALKDIQNFKNLFFYEDITPEVVEHKEVKDF